MPVPIAVKLAHNVPSSYQLKHKPVVCIVDEAASTSVPAEMTGPSLVQLFVSKSNNLPSHRWELRAQ